VNPALPAQNVRELIALGKAKNGELRMASAGIGSVSHLAGAAFASAAGFKVLHVPYKGGSQGVASVVSGETDFVLTPAPAALSLVAGKRLRLLGHSMAATTQPLGPTPAIASELPGFEFSSWIGLMAPRGLPAAVTDALAKAVATAVQRPEVQKAFESNGAVAHPSTPEEFRAYLARDIEANRRAVAAAGVQAE
jgi:tripartite-type tricarboxylate transporter receptor subunit TctC